MKPTLILVPSNLARDDAAEFERMYGGNRVSHLNSENEKLFESHDGETDGEMLVCVFPPPKGMPDMLREAAQSSDPSTSRRFVSKSLLKSPTVHVGRGIYDTVETALENGIDDSIKVVVCARQSSGGWAAYEVSGISSIPNGSWKDAYGVLTLGAAVALPDPLVPRYDFTVPLGAVGWYQHNPLPPP